MKTNQDQLEILRSIRPIHSAFSGAGKVHGWSRQGCAFDTHLPVFLYRLHHAGVRRLNMDNSWEIQSFELVRFMICTLMLLQC